MLEQRVALRYNQNIWNKARAARGHFLWRGKNGMEKPSNFITEIIDEDLARGAVKEIHTVSYTHLTLPTIA